jgi:hypothetical protein
MTQSQATAQIQAEYPDMFVHCFGEAFAGFDFGVYSCEADFDADAIDNDNTRMMARITVAGDA